MKTSCRKVHQVLVNADGKGYMKSAGLVIITWTTVYSFSKTETERDKPACNDHVSLAPACNGVVFLPHTSGATPSDRYIWGGVRAQQWPATLAFLLPPCGEISVYSVLNVSRCCVQGDSVRTENALLTKVTGAYVLNGLKTALGYYSNGYRGYHTDSGAINL